MRLEKLRFELKLHPLHYLFVGSILFLALFVRVYRTDALLRFYYDQGRDFLILKEMVETPKPVLVGPTTGLAGILRGPAYYYLLLPAYLIGGGSPLISAYWLQVLNIVGLIFLYWVARTLYGKTAGIFVLLLMSFSNGIVDLSRWLSNPAPIFFSVPLMLFGLIQIKQQRRADLWWPIVALMLGLNLQFEIASEIWFLPAIILLAVINKDVRPKWRTALICVCVFGATLIPQVIFDIRHQGILRQGIAENFGQSTGSAFVFVKEKFVYRWRQFTDIYANILVQRDYDLLKILAVLGSLFLIDRTNRKNSFVLLVLLITPVAILSFYQGNYGNFYSYYMIGTFPIFMLLLAGILSWYWRIGGLKILVILFFVLFLNKNGILVKNFLIAGTDGPENVVLNNQLQAIDWVYQLAGDREFNVDTYVPPVIPYAYDYLFSWYGEGHYQRLPQEDLRPLLYTIYEVDPPHPERLEAWLKRQAGIGRVVKEQSFGGVVVQERQRL